MAMGKLAALLVGAAGLGPVWALRAKGSQDSRASLSVARAGVQGDAPEIPDEDLKRPSCAGVECLERYVHQEDGAFSWRRLDVDLQGHSPDKVVCWSAVAINMTSQRWTNEADVNPPLWWHLLVIFTPSNLGQLGANTTDWATLLLGTSDNTKPLEPGNADIAMTASFAMATGARAAVLFQVPNSPLVFADDPNHAEKTEEEAKAWTWHYVDSHPDRYDYLIEMPMTKAAVKAMDTIQAVTAGAVRRFAITGYSKRGLVSVLTASIDKRVHAVMSGCHQLALEQHKRDHLLSFNHPPLAAIDYVKFATREHSTEPSGKSLFGFLDPVSKSSASEVYLSRLQEIPKLFMEVGNDDFFVVDSAKNFLRELRGPTSFIMHPNSRHLPGYSWTSHAPSAIGFVQGTIMQHEVPKISWTVDSVTGSVTARQESDHTPVSVKFWTALTCPASKRRDFRWYTNDTKSVCLACGGEFEEDREVCSTRYSTWNSQDLLPEKGGDGRTWVANVEAPPAGWRAGFVEMTYNWPMGQEKFRATSEVSVMPKEYPFPPCHDRDECRERSQVLVLAQQ